MSNLTIRIAGRDFTVACAPGEEGHIDSLGRVIDGRLSDLGEDPRAMSETRALLFASLLLADDLHDLRTKAAQPVPTDPALVARIEALADRLENIAMHLEDRAPSA